MFRVGRQMKRYRMASIASAIYPVRRKRVLLCVLKRGAATFNSPQTDSAPNRRGMLCAIDAGGGAVTNVCAVATVQPAKRCEKR